MPAATSRLTYRKPEASDVQRLFAIFGDPQTNLFNPNGPMASLADAQRLLDHWLEQWATQGYGWWAVARSEQPERIIGFGGVAPLNYLTERRINLGYRFAVEAWGQGFATQLGRDALAQAFGPLRLQAARCGQPPTSRSLEWPIVRASGRAGVGRRPGWPSGRWD